MGLQPVLKPQAKVQQPKKMKHNLYKTKKPLDRSPAVVSLIFRSQVILNYLTESVAAAAVSTAAESAAVSTTAVSESAEAVF